MAKYVFKAYVFVNSIGVESKQELSKPTTVSSTLGGKTGMQQNPPWLVEIGQNRKPLA